MKLHSFFVALLVSLALSATACSGGNGVGSNLSRILGQAFAQEFEGEETNEVPLGDGTIVLLQIDDEGAVQSAQVGTTDAQGNFVVDVEAQAVIAIVVSGTTNDGDTEISGLFNPDQPMISKDLNVATSVACIAGLSAIGDGSITDEQLDETRVANLEDAAVDYIAANPDFDSYESAQVDAAVAAVRSATDDGAHPADPGAFTS